MSTTRFSNHSGFAKLELLLVLAFAALLFQVFPGLWFGLLAVLDIRGWSRGAWLVQNLAVVFTLFALRFGPDWYHDWQQRQIRKSAAAKKREKQVKDLTAEEQRALYKRLQEARKRQVI
jgi:hypothetical protein